MTPRRSAGRRWLPLGAVLASLTGCVPPYYQQPYPSSYPTPLLPPPYVSQPGIEPVPQSSVDTLGRGPTPLLPAPLPPPEPEPAPLSEGPAAEPEPLPQAEAAPDAQPSPATPAPLERPAAPPAATAAPDGPSPFQGFRPMRGQTRPAP